MLAMKISSRQMKIKQRPNLVRKPLEELTVLLETNRHAQALPKTNGCDYCSLINVFCSPWYLIKSFLRVQCTEGFADMEMSYKVSHTSDQVLVRPMVRLNRM